MQKVLLILSFVVISICVQGQNLDSVDSKKMQYFLRIDSLQSQVIEMNNRLHSFQYQNRISQKLYGISFICTITSILVLTDMVESDKITKVGLPIMAGVSFGLGKVVYLDSFKFFDKNRKIKKHF